jgi:hypothetical protein
MGILLLLACFLTFFFSAWKIAAVIVAVLTIVFVRGEAWFLLGPVDLSDIFEALAEIDWSDIDWPDIDLS